MKLRLNKMHIMEEAYLLVLSVEKMLADNASRKRFDKGIGAYNGRITIQRME
jgi:hypothetical protein